MITVIMCSHRRRRRRRHHRRLERFASFKALFVSFEVADIRLHIILEATVMISN